MKVTDFRGKVLNVGDTIAYPGHSGMNLWMNQGKIVEIQQNIDKWGREYFILKVLIRPERIIDVLRIDLVVKIAP